MKIEVGESLGYSYLRHVKRCWLVQTNWKPSEHWGKCIDEGELEKLFEEMRNRFNVFKENRKLGQFLQQSEIDVLGLGQDGSIHAIEIAFHEAGLNYGGREETKKRVFKKMLRSYLILKAYRPKDTKLHIHFLSPKVNTAYQQPLEDTFYELRENYGDADWNLRINDNFVEEVLQPTLDNALSVADTSELFIRSARLLRLAKFQNRRKSSPDFPTPDPAPKEEQIQPIVKKLMKTLLDDHPDFLSEDDLNKLMDADYCRDKLGLKLGGFPLLRRIEDGRYGPDDRPRFWVKVYGERYLVVNNWWKDYHLHNAERLLCFVSEIIECNPHHPAIPSLESIRKLLEDYIQ